MLVYEHTDECRSRPPHYDHCTCGAEGDPRVTLADAVGQLPTTTVGITEMLLNEGVTGEPCSADHCPLALYLSGRTGRKVWVNRRVAYDLAGPVVHLPRHIAVFVEDFDDGQLEGREELISGT